MKKIILTLSILLLFILHGISVCSAADWAKYWIHEDGSVLFYDKESIEIDKEIGIVQVKEKIIFNAKQREDIIRFANNHGMVDESWNNVESQQYLVLVDCENKKRKELARTIFASDGTELFALPPYKSTWRDIVPNSVGDGLRKKLCK